MSDLTRLLSAAAAGDHRAAADLLTAVYDELRKLAAVQMSQEKPGHTLNPTALVNEAYLRLVIQRHDGNDGIGPADLPRFANHRHFFAAAAEAMRRILIESARRKLSLKHGGNRGRTALSDVAASDPDEMLLALDEALHNLSESDSLGARVVELHHFAGLTQEQTAEALGITVYQVRQKWNFARAWLKAVLTKP